MGNTELSESDNLGSELLERIWSVISFDKCEATHLTYSEAIAMMDDLDSQRIPGLCIVTNEAADKISQ